MKLRYFTIVLILFVVSGAFAGNLRLGSPLTEHMVLQHDMPIKVWEEATVESTVIVKLKDKIVSAEVNSHGKWKTTLPKQKAGGPYSFSVSSGNESFSFNDVMIGEVWICSGQSNMFMSYKGKK